MLLAVEIIKKLMVFLVAYLLLTPINNTVSADMLGDYLSARCSSSLQRMEFSTLTAPVGYNVSNPNGEAGIYEGSSAKGQCDFGDRVLKWEASAIPAPSSYRCGSAFFGYQLSVNVDDVAVLDRVTLTGAPDCSRGFRSIVVYAYHKCTKLGCIEIELSPSEKFETPEVIKYPMGMASFVDFACARDSVSCNESVYVSNVISEKANIHPSVSRMARNILEWETDKFHIRVDQLGDNTYRYAAWSVGDSMLSEPDIVINNGQLVGRINKGYEFINGNYKYICEFGKNESLKVFNGDKLVLESKVTKSY